MRSIASLAVAVLLFSGPASAEPWPEFAFESAGFAAQYPSKPEMQETLYKTAMAPGGSVKQQVYAVNSGGVTYKVAVADFRAASADEDKTIDEAAAAMMARGKLTHDERGRIDWHYGREIRIEDAAGTSDTNAIFFIEKRLYQIEVVYPKVNSDPAGSSGIHFFQQAFRLLP